MDYIYVLCENSSPAYFRSFEAAAQSLIARMIALGYSDTDKLFDKNFVPFDWKMIDNIRQAVEDTGCVMTDEDYIWLEKCELED